MMRFKGWAKGWAMTAGFVLAATAANAQMLAPPDAGRSSYHAVSDFDGPGPYAAMPPAPPPGPPPVYNYGGYGPPMMPPQEVYAVLRDNGFSPLGAPHQRGFVYFIAAVDRGGNDGRLVIDARNGRILRFMPSYGGYGPGPYVAPFGPDRMPGYGPETSLPPPTVIRGGPRPPASIPHVASRAVPLPSPKPAVAGDPPSAVPQQSAAIEAKPAAAPAPAHASPPPSTQASATTSTTTVGEAKPPTDKPLPAKPQPAIQATQPMPAAQGLE
jgi:hypothetical protein